MSALAASILLIYLYRYLTSESGKYVTVSSRGFKPALIDLKRSKYPLMGVVGLLSFVLIVLPVMVLFYTSMLPRITSYNVCYTKLLRKGEERETCRTKGQNPPGCAAALDPEWLFLTGDQASS